MRLFPWWEDGAASPSDADPRPSGRCSPRSCSSCHQSTRTSWSTAGFHPETRYRKVEPTAGRLPRSGPGAAWGCRSCSDWRTCWSSGWTRTRYRTENPRRETSGSRSRTDSRSRTPRSPLQGSEGVALATRMGTETPSVGFVLLLLSDRGCNTKTRELVLKTTEDKMR